MKFQMQAVDEDAATHLSSLERWFLHDPDIAGKCKIEKVPATIPGAMSGTFSAVIAITSQAMTLGNLLIAYSTWRRARSAPADRIKAIVDLGESTVEISGMNDEEIRALVVAIIRQDGIE